MKKTGSFIVLFAALLVLAAIALAPIIMSGERSQKNLAGEKSTHQAELKPEIAAKYSVVEKDGELSVYKDGKEDALVTAKVNIDSLRELDRKSIREGIRVDTAEEAVALVEDFIS